VTTLAPGAALLHPARAAAPAPARKFRSGNGVLNATLTAAVGDVRVRHHTFNAFFIAAGIDRLYSGSPPALALHAPIGARRADGHGAHRSLVLFQVASRRAPGIDKRRLGSCARPRHENGLFSCRVGDDYWHGELRRIGSENMSLPTEPIGSIPRPAALIEGVRSFEEGRSSQQELDALYDSAIRDTIQLFEATGSPVITDGEQAKQSFATYSIHGLKNVSPDGIPILFADGHVRNFPRLICGPFHYKTPADVYLEMAQRHAHVPVKQAVASASALSLLYPQSGIRGYSQRDYLDAMLLEQEGEIRRCLQKGAHVVQIDFTEGRLSIKLDPTRRLLESFIDLNSLLIERFSADERKRIGVHSCSGGDRRSSHSAEVDYAELLPSLFRLQVGNFYLQLASEPDRRRVLKIVQEHSKAEQRIFVGVTDPLDPRVETSDEIRDRVLEAAEYIPLDRLGTTDDCGFAPFSDDTSRSRDVAFAKIRSRVAGTALAADMLGVN
jgi:5-methyltetrahydropteroyltriglutamate--homocysteine methyltransferase